MEVAESGPHKSIINVAALIRIAILSNNLVSAFHTRTQAIFQPNITFTAKTISDRLHASPDLNIFSKVQTCIQDVKFGV